MSESSFFKNVVIPIPYPEATARETEEPVNPDQCPFAVDEGRVIFSSVSYKLLGDKTQVILQARGDKVWIPRDRQVHSQEVAYTAARVASNLSLNLQLAKVVALAHDLGHPPYGHSGERTLDQLLKGKGEVGFDHEEQTLRVVTRLEQIEPHFPGLNLTNQVIMDLSARVKREQYAFLPEGYPRGCASLEAQVVEWSDKVTFIVHDLEDLVTLGIISCEELMEQELLRKIFREIQKEMCVSDYEQIRLRLRQLKKKIYNYFLTSIYRNCNDLLEYIRNVRRRKNLNNWIFITETRLIKAEPDTDEEFVKLLNWMYEHIYTHRMREHDVKAAYTIDMLFNKLYAYEDLRDLYNQLGLIRDPNESLARHISDLIVMSSERFIRRFFENVILA